jgi:HAD superfamily hydrolase (TIGR01509 family)
MHLLFDLDGVLVEFAVLHRTAFLKAWNSVHGAMHPVDIHFHAKHLEARSTKQKLALLAEHFSTDPRAQEVSLLKQFLTQELLAKASVYKRTVSAISWAHQHNIPMSVCSNSIRATVEASLEKLAPLSTFAVILSNEDVGKPKPDPEIYNTAVARLGVHPSEVMVFEDSAVGKQAARSAGLQVVEVVDALDISPRFLLDTLGGRIGPAPVYNIVIPMAGLGSRFSVAGYTTPKPFLPIFGTPMYLKVIQNVIPAELFDRARIHIIVRADHTALFEAEEKPANIQIHTVPALTEGAACTVLSIKEVINNDAPLVIANSDQYLEWDVANFYRCLTHPDWDGIISTFHQPDPSDIRWSYARLNGEGEVTAVAEKQYISAHATTGIYGWKRGSEFVADAEAMIVANIRVNKEFYVCPVYNTGIDRGRKFRTLHCTKMWGLGVPADYEHFLANGARI